MANSDFLRHNINQHTIKNSKSKKMDKEIIQATNAVIETLEENHPKLQFSHRKTMKANEIIELLSAKYPAYENDYGRAYESSFISPDGGFLFAKDTETGKEEIVLVSEVKRQGTNDARLEEGLGIQAKGNAIERLGKNLIGIRAIFKDDDLIPFVVFGHGYDFQEGSTILDRVLTMNEFFPLNKEFVKKDYLPFEPVTMLFRQEIWTVDEMIEHLLSVAEKAIEIYFPGK